MRVGVRRVRGARVAFENKNKPVSPPICAIFFLHVVCIRVATSSTYMCVGVRRVRGAWVAFENKNKPVSPPIVVTMCTVRVSVKPGLWTVDWTVDWTMDWTMDWTLDWTSCAIPLTCYI